MENRCAIADALALVLLAGCGGNLEVSYDDPPRTIVPKAWRVVDVWRLFPMCSVFQTTICLRVRPVVFGMENPSGIAACRWQPSLMRD